MTSASSLLGAAGEHFVMCQLLRNGFIAALAPAGVPNCDIVVTDDIGDRLCAIQVKTRREIGSDGGWHMRKKHETIVGKRLFYTFLDFGTSPTEPPTCYVIPSQRVAEVLTLAHSTWLATPGKKGQQRQDGDLRRLLPDYDRMGISIGCGPGWLEPYREAWNSLVEHYGRNR